MLDAQYLVRLHDDATEQWHRNVAPTPQTEAMAMLALLQHRANFDLWHEEDKARSQLAPDGTIAEVKHAIDRLNQQRNDLVEQMDEALLREAASQNDSAALHSETPGMIVDRLSILSLKIYHTAEEAHRVSAREEHRQKNLQRLAVLERQRTDLTGCLHDLWQEIQQGRRRFKLYRQMKMYNDPELNPVLYAAHSS